MIFRCPQCQEPLQSTEVKSGDLIQCPGCQQTIEVPFPKKPSLPSKQIQTSSRQNLLPESIMKVSITSIDLPLGAVFAVTLKVCVSVFVIGFVFGVIAYALVSLASVIH